MFTPKEAEVINDDRWDNWFWGESEGIPSRVRRGEEELLDLWQETEKEKDDPFELWGMTAYGFGKSSMQEGHVHDNLHPANVLRRAVEGEDEAFAAVGRGLEVVTWDGQDHPDTPDPDNNCHGQSFMFYRPVTASSINMMENDLEYVRFGMAAMKKIADAFPQYICWTNNRPYLSGIGSCWNWSLDQFDTDHDRKTTLKNCLKVSASECLK